jgi:hypothetical protein
VERFSHSIDAHVDDQEPPVAPVPIRVGHMETVTYGDIHFEICFSRKNMFSGRFFSVVVGWYRGNKAALI